MMKGMIAVLYQLPHAPSRSSLAVREDRGPLYGFSEDLREFICRRLDKVNPYEESKEYCRQQEKASRLYERLEGMLPEEGRLALLQYGEALGAAHCLETEMLGERAFLDGVRVVLRAMGEYLP